MARIWQKMFPSGIFSKCYIKSSRSLSFFLYVENIFTVCKVPRVKGYKNDKMLKSQLDSNCLKFGRDWVYPHYRQLPGPPLLESPVLSGGDGVRHHIFCLLHLALGTYFTCKSHPFAVGLLLDEAGFPKVLEKPVIDVANRLLRWSGEANC